MKTDTRNQAKADVDALADYLRLNATETRNAIMRARELEAKNNAVPEINSFLLLSLRLRLEGKRPPGVLAGVSAKRAYASEIAQLDQERQTLVDAAQAALDELAEASEILKDVSGYVLSKIECDQPRLFSQIAPLLKDDELIERANSFNRKRDEMDAALRWAADVDARNSGQVGTRCCTGFNRALLARHHGLARRSEASR